MYRNIDDLGRLTIPIDMRNKLGIENGSEVKVELVANKIIVTNPKEIDYESKYKELKRKMQEKIELYELKKCSVCEEYFEEDDLVNTEGMLNGGIGYVCEQCIEDGDIKYI